MTSLIEKLVAIIAPHDCFLCGKEDNVLCDACRLSLAIDPPSLCYLCDKETNEHRVCYACSQRTHIGHVWYNGPYHGELGKLVKRFKFSYTQAAARPLAQLLAQQLPILSSETVLVPIPTASVRVRQRGYDHALLLARELGRELHLPVRQLLSRRTAVRQVGANRQQRFRQAEELLYAPQSSVCRGLQILLIDDVVTTGATITAAASVLKKSGAHEVDAAVVAKQQLS